MKILVNDEEMALDDPITVEDLVSRLGYPDKGIAVAVDWAVLPRSDWHTVLADGARVEVVTAVQGG